MPRKASRRNCSVNTDDVEFETDVRSICNDERRGQQRRAFDRRDLLNHFPNIGQDYQRESSYGEGYRSSSTENRKRGRKARRKSRTTGYVHKDSTSPDIRICSCARNRTRIPEVRPMKQNYQDFLKHDRVWPNPVPNLDESLRKKRASKSPRGQGGCCTRCTEMSPKFYARYSKRDSKRWPDATETSSFELLKKWSTEKCDRSRDPDGRSQNIRQPRDWARANFSLDPKLITDQFNRLRDRSAKRDNIYMQKSIANDDYEDRTDAYSSGREWKRCCEPSVNVTSKLFSRRFDGEREGHARTEIDPSKQTFDCHGRRPVTRESLNRASFDGDTSNDGRCSKSAGRERGRMRSLVGERNACCAERARDFKGSAGRPSHSFRTQKAKQWLEGRQDKERTGHAMDSANDHRCSRNVIDYDRANSTSYSYKGAWSHEKETGKSVPLGAKNPARQIPESRSLARDNKRTYTASPNNRRLSDNDPEHRSCFPPTERRVPGVEKWSRNEDRSVGQHRNCAARLATVEAERVGSSKPNDRCCYEKVVDDLRSFAGRSTDGRVRRDKFKLEDLTPDVPIDHWRVSGKHWDKMTDEYRKLTGTLKSTQTEAAKEMESPEDRVRKRFTRTYPSGKEFSFEVSTPARKELRTNEVDAEVDVDCDRGQSACCTPGQLEENSCTQPGQTKDADFEFRKKHEARWRRNLFPSAEIDDAKASERAAACKRAAGNKFSGRSCCSPKKIIERESVKSVTRDSGNVGARKKVVSCPCASRKRDVEIEPAARPCDVHNSKFPRGKLSLRLARDSAGSKCKNDALSAQRSSFSARKNRSSPLSRKRQDRSVCPPRKSAPCSPESRLPTSSNRSKLRHPSPAKFVGENGESEGSSWESSCRRSPARDSGQRSGSCSPVPTCLRIVRPKSKADGKTKSQKILIYPPNDDDGVPLTLYKSSSRINCELKGDFRRGFRYNVTYVQKFVSSRWCPAERTSRRFVGKKCECSSDYG